MFQIREMKISIARVRPISKIVALMQVVISVLHVHQRGFDWGYITPNLVGSAVIMLVPEMTHKFANMC